MSKKILFLVLPFLLSSCGWLWGKKPMEGRPVCPVIMVKQDAVQFAGGTIEVRLKGYDAYCYYNENIKGTVAVINPTFEAARIGASDESDVHFAYYTETLKGPPEYLGVKTRYMKLDVPFSLSSKEIKGKTIEVRVPAGMEDTFSINLGLTAKKRNSI